MDTEKKTTQAINNVEMAECVSNYLFENASMHVLMYSQEHQDKHRIFYDIRAHIRYVTSGVCCEALSCTSTITDYDYRQHTEMLKCSTGIGSH